MDRKLNLVLALACGLLGGVASRYFVPVPVLAQAQQPFAKEITAQRFVLLDDRGAVVGVFRPEEIPFSGGGPKKTVALEDATGNVVWRAAEIRVGLAAPDNPVRVIPLSK